MAFLAVGSNGTIVSSDDGAAWTPRTSGVTDSLVRVTWSAGLGLWCAVGQNGTIVTSPDGVTWTAQTSGVSTYLEDVVWSPQLGIFVVVGDGDVCLTSPDGVTWTPQNAGFSGNDIGGVTWSPTLGLFVACGFPSRIATSPDGVTWTGRTSSFAANLWLATAEWSPEQGVFVVAGDTGKLATSSNGTSWTQRTTGFGSGTIADAQWGAGAGVFVITGIGTSLKSSPTGVTWTSRTSGLFWPNCLAWSPELNLFVTVSQTANGSGIIKASTSSDGLTWTVGTYIFPDFINGLGWSPPPAPRARLTLRWKVAIRKRLTVRWDVEVPRARLTVRWNTKAPRARLTVRWNTKAPRGHLTARWAVKPIRPRLTARWNTKAPRGHLTARWAVKPIRPRLTVRWNTTLVRPRLTARWNTKAPRGHLTARWAVKPIRPRLTARWNTKLVRARLTTRWNTKAPRGHLTARWAVKPIRPRLTTRWATKTIRPRLTARWAVKTKRARLTLRWNASQPRAQLGIVWRIRSGVTVLIGGDMVRLAADSLRIPAALGDRTTADFTVLADVGGLYRKGQPVEIYDQSDVLVFAGVIDEPSEARVGTADDAVFLVDVDCVGWQYRTDKRLAAASYVDTPAGDIVTDLLERYLLEEGLTAGLIQSGPTIPAAVFAYVTVTSALDRLAAASGGWVWWISHDRQLNFHDRSAASAPWEVTGVDAVDDSVKVSQGSGEYRKREYVPGTDVTSPQTETRTGDGDTRTWSMAYPLDAVPTVNVNGSPKTVGIRGVDIGKDFYWNRDDNIISQDSGATPLTSGEDLNVIYRGRFRMIAVAEDPSAILDLQALEQTGSGLVEHVAQADASVTSREAALASAGAALLEHARFGRTLSFTTERSGLAAGQWATVHFAPHGLDGVEMLITSVELHSINGILTWSVTATDGPNRENWAALFAPPVTGLDLSAVDASALILLTSTSEAAGWAEAVDQAVYACPIPSTGLYPSEELYPC